MKRSYRIEVSDHYVGKVLYPQELQGLVPFTRIAFGTRALDATFLPHHDRRNTITISPDIAKAIYYPADLDLSLHVFTEEHTLHIGPLIGIFTSAFSPFAMKPIGERTSFFAKLLSVKEFVGALPFVFGEQHIDWDQGTIEALLYHQGVWRTLTLPFPNVIYDRLPNRRSEKKASLRKVKERLQNEYLIPWYNPGFFNKLEVNERLQNVYHVAHYLPETHPFTSFSTVERMLAHYGHVYVKPMNGSLGLGILQIVYDREEDSYFCRYRDENGNNRLQKFDTLETLIKHRIKPSKLPHMLVQQGIHLLRHDKRPVDFRVHTNKDADGVWKVTAIAAKVAGPGSVTTHVKSGGTILTLDEIVDDALEREQLTTRLSQAALRLSQAIDQQIEGMIGEIGFDLGVDKNGKVWLFEANSKPGRSIFQHPSLKEFDLLTRKLSLAFAIFITEQTIRQPGKVFK